MYVSPVLRATVLVVSVPVKSVCIGIRSMTMPNVKLSKPVEDDNDWQQLDHQPNLTSALNLSKVAFGRKIRFLLGELNIDSDAEPAAQFGR